MKHLLVPIDFSEYAYNASLYALHLASSFGGKVTVFHTYHIPIVDPLMPAEYLSDLAETAEKDNKANMEKIVGQLQDHRAKHHLKEIEISSYVTMGFPVDEIILACQKLSPDIIVIGRRYTEGMTKILLGSVTSAVVEKASVPVLVIPENVSAEKAVTDVLYASEFDEADINALSALLQFTKPLGGKVHCIHIVKEGDSSQQKLEELEKSYASEEKAGQIDFHNISSANVMEGLLKYVEANHISAMAMLTHRRSFFAGLFDRSLTQKIAFKTNIPLMVFHGNKK